MRHVSFNDFLSYLKIPPVSLTPIIDILGTVWNFIFGQKIQSLEFTEGISCLTEATVTPGNTKKSLTKLPKMFCRGGWLCQSPNQPVMHHQTCVYSPTPRLTNDQMNIIYSPYNMDELILEELKSAQSCIGEINSISPRLDIFNFDKSPVICLSKTIWMLYRSCGIV